MPSIVELGYENNIRVVPEITENIPLSSINQEIPNKAIDLAKMTIDTFQVNQHIRGGADGYDSGVGWWIGRDIDGVAKLFFGDSAGDKVTWDGTALTITGDLIAGELHIPDKTTADSFHVDSAGNAWWGCNEADFIADPDNAIAYILKDGTTKLSTLVVADTGMTLEDIYGDGSDGDVTLTGTTTLTRDMFYDDLDLDGNTLNTAGYRIFVKGTMSGTGTIKNDGNVGSNGANGSSSGGPPRPGGAGGAGGAASTGNSVPAGVAGSSGGAGGAGGQNAGGGAVGTAGTAGSDQAKAMTEENGVAGGAGGTGGGNSGAGGAAGVAGNATGTVLNKIRNVMSAYFLSDHIGGLTNFTVIGGGGGSGGGGGGGTSGANTLGGGGGGGGGAGSSGGVVWISARIVTFTGTIQSVGGAGGDGGDGGDGSSSGASTIGYGGSGGAAGSGGSGGVIILITSTTTTPYSTSIVGGVAGSVGSGGRGSYEGSFDPTYDGVSGNAGNDGNNGTVITLTI